MSHNVSLLNIKFTTFNGRLNVWDTGKIQYIWLSVSTVDFGLTQNIELKVFRSTAMPGRRVPRNLR